MPLIFIVRLLLSLASLAILGTGAYLAWSWWDGSWEAVGGAGDLVHVRETWRLVVALLLLALSFLGRFLVLPLAARPDRDAPRPAQPWTLEHLVSPTGSQLRLASKGPETAPTVVLTHGWGLDHTIWDTLSEALSDRFRVVAWDLPGLGGSKPPRGAEIGLDLFARDLAAILDGTEGPVVLVGHSIGGMILQTLVRDHAAALEKVKGLVLLNTTYTNPLRTMALSPLAQALRRPVLEPSLWLTILLAPLAQLSAWQSYLSGSAHLANRVGFASKVTRSQLEQTTLLTTRNSQAASARGNLAMFQWDATDALARAHTPVLIVGGQQDLVTKPGASQVMAATTPGATLRLIDHANHMGFLEHLDAYAPEIEAFCERALAQPEAGAAAMA
jgi:pimeloyl-ACP methyl ester carboxylesterase